jgi:hypothetical protein
VKQDTHLDLLTKQDLRDFSAFGCSGWSNLEISDKTTNLTLLTITSQELTSTSLTKRTMLRADTKPRTHTHRTTKTKLLSHNEPPFFL